MVFPGASTRTHPFSSSRSFPSNNQIVRKIVPNNDNMSLFEEIESEYTLEIEGETSKSREDHIGAASPLVSKTDSRSEFNTPVPAKRPLIQTSYVFEKELREDFDNPYCIDSSEDEQGQEEEGQSKLCSSQSLESRVSEESLGSRLGLYFSFANRLLP